MEKLRFPDVVYADLVGFSVPQCEEMSHLRCCRQCCGKQMNVSILIAYQGDDKSVKTDLPDKLLLCKL